MATVAAGLALFAASLPCAAMGIMIVRNLWLNWHSAASARMIAYGFGPFTFEGWQMYAFPVLCLASTAFLAVSGLRLLFPRRRCNNQKPSEL